MYVYVCVCMRGRGGGEVFEIIQNKIIMMINEKGL